jgi:hypothetical protein
MRMALNNTTGPRYANCPIHDAHLHTFVLMDPAGKKFLWCHHWVGMAVTIDSGCQPCTTNSHHQDRKNISTLSMHACMHGAFTCQCNFLVLAVYATVLACWHNAEALYTLH